MLWPRNGNASVPIDWRLAAPFFARDNLYGWDYAHDILAAQMPSFGPSPESMVVTVGPLSQQLSFYTGAEWA
jgi:hypothetical protein